MSYYNQYRAIPYRRHYSGRCRRKSHPNCNLTRSRNPVHANGRSYSGIATWSYTGRGSYNQSSGWKTRIRYPTNFPSHFNTLCSYRSNHKSEKKRNFDTGNWCRSSNSIKRTRCFGGPKTVFHAWNKKVPNPIGYSNLSMSWNKWKRYWSNAVRCACGYSCHGPNTRYTTSRV